MTGQPRRSNYTKKKKTHNQKPLCALSEMGPQQSSMQPGRHMSITDLRHMAADRQEPSTKYMRVCRDDAESFMLHLLQSKEAKGPVDLSTRQQHARLLPYLLQTLESMGRVNHEGWTCAGSNRTSQLPELRFGTDDVIYSLDRGNKYGPQKEQHWKLLGDHLSWMASAARIHYATYEGLPLDGPSELLSFDRNTDASPVDFHRAQLTAVATWPWRSCWAWRRRPY